MVDESKLKQERAEFEAVASDYGAYPKAIERDAKGNYLLMHTATGWMWWQAARCAQVVQSVAGVEGGVIRGEPTFAKPPAPPAAPVQMPGPLAIIEGVRLKWHIPDGRYSLPVRYLQGTHNLYTEHQVRQLLADHGIK